MQRLRRLDGVRGLLAVYVMLGHAVPLTVFPGALLAHGQAAVDLFFALSGLVITASLERFGWRFWPFMLARSKRLLPVYYLVLGFSLALGWAGDPLASLPWAGTPARDIVSPALPPLLWAHVLAHLSLLHGLVPTQALPFAWVTLLGPAWSLSTEWQFYLLIGLLAPRRMGRVALILLGVGACYRLAPLAGSFSRAFLPDAAPYFALGMATAAWHRGGRPTAFWICLAGATALGLLAGPGKALPPLLWGLVVAAQRRPFGRVLEAGPLLYLGAISYPLYLVNEPVQRLLALGLGPLAHGRALWFSCLFLPLAILGSLAAAAALHHAVELPVMRRNNKILLSVIAPPVRQ